jgi:hypothetical protein
MTPRAQRKASFDEIEQRLSTSVGSDGIELKTGEEEVILTLPAQSNFAVKLRLVSDDFNKPHLAVIREKQGGPPAPDIETGEPDHFTPYQEKFEFDEGSSKWHQKGADGLSFTASEIANLAKSLVS